MDLNTVVVFVHDYLYVYLWVIFTTFLNLIAPLSGSAIVTPVTAYFTDIQRAIAISAFTFVLSGIHRVYLFRHTVADSKENTNVLKVMLPITLVGAILGGLFISYVPTKLLVSIVIVVSLYFMYKTVMQLLNKGEMRKQRSLLELPVVTLLSGFLQAAGMPGSDIRNNYLRTRMEETSVRAVGSIVGILNFLVGGTIIFVHNKLLPTDIIFVISLLPFLVLSQEFGKKILDKIPDAHAKIIALSLSLIGITLLAYKYLL